MSDVLLGVGLSTGMFYHAPKGTSYPTYPTETLGVAWVEVGDITSDGITVTTDKSTENLKNWANVIKRVIMTDHNETVQAPIMDTTQEVLETVLGSSNVTTTAANATHGALVTAALSSSELPDAEEFLFIMKDGDDTIAIGCTGQIQAMEAVTFAPGSAINWTPTITVLDNSLIMITDDGQTI